MQEKGCGDRHAGKQKLETTEYWEEGKKREWE